MPRWRVYATVCKTLTTVVIAPTEAEAEEVGRETFRAEGHRPRSIVAVRIVGVEKPGK